jgi:hypothetical protein
MIHADFEARQQLALERRDELAREMRVARSPRPTSRLTLAVRRGLGRAHIPTRILARSKPSQQLAQEV